VELYTTSWCRYCKDAIAFLRKNNISFQEFDVEKNPASAQRMRSLGGTGGVPFALINGQTVTGFSPPLYKRALGLR
jgi:glutaredoxin